MAFFLIHQYFRRQWGRTQEQIADHLVGAPIGDEEEDHVHIRQRSHQEVRPPPGLYHHCHRLYDAGPPGLGLVPAVLL